MSTIETCCVSAATGVPGWAATVAGATGAADGAGDGATVVVPPDVAVELVVAAGVFDDPFEPVDVTAGLAGCGAASPGNSFGAAHCRIAMKTIEMRTAG